jgi:hypothetical protein
LCGNKLEIEEEETMGQTIICSHCNFREEVNFNRRRSMLNFLPGIVEGDLDQELIIKLTQASFLSGIDFTITSGYRPGVDGVDHGLTNGPHMSHKAADIRCHDSPTRFAILKGLFNAGFNRIGWNNIHIHADTCTMKDDNKPENVVWIEPDQTV